MDLAIAIGLLLLMLYPVWHAMVMNRKAKAVNEYIRLLEARSTAERADHG